MAQSWPVGAQPWPRRSQTRGRSKSNHKHYHKSNNGHQKNNNDQDENNDHQKYNGHNNQNDYSHKKDRNRWRRSASRNTQGRSRAKSYTHEDNFKNYTAHLTKKQIAGIEPIAPALIQVAKEHESFSSLPAEDDIKKVCSTTQVNRHWRLTDQVTGAQQAQ
eukprot:4899343-Pyramimonas_sp.AAC.1